jgi:tRNA G46 methylase TrmB
MDWSTYYPTFVNEASMDEASQHRRLTKDVEVIDIGCGFGGLLFALSPVMPDKLLLGERECA